MVWQLLPLRNPKPAMARDQSVLFPQIGPPAIRMDVRPDENRAFVDAIFSRVPAGDAIGYTGRNYPLSPRNTAENVVFARK